MSNIAKIIIVAIVILLAVIGINYMRGSKKPTTNSGILTEDFVAGSGENQDFLRALKNLESVSLDGEVIRSAAFVSLVDFSVALVEQPKGRPNPFRPINPLERDLSAFGDSTSTSSR